MTQLLESYSVQTGYIVDRLWVIEQLVQEVKDPEVETTVIGPDGPVAPAVPVAPVEPAVPVAPVAPAAPVLPVAPFVPFVPAGPVPVALATQYPAAGAELKVGDTVAITPLPVV